MEIGNKVQIQNDVGYGGNDGRTKTDLFASGRDVDIPNQTEAQGFNRVKTAVLYSEKLRKLGWVPQTDMKDGMRLTMDIIAERKKTHE